MQSPSCPQPRVLWPCQPPKITVCVSGQLQQCRLPHLRRSSRQQPVWRCTRGTRTLWKMWQPARVGLPSAAVLGMAMCIYGAQVTRRLHPRHTPITELICKFKAFALSPSPVVFSVSCLCVGHCAVWRKVHVHATPAACTMLHVCQHCLSCGWHRHDRSGSCDSSRGGCYGTCHSRQSSEQEA